jgi:hypothetical protein
MELEGLVQKEVEQEFWFGKISSSATGKPGMNSLSAGHSNTRVKRIVRPKNVR